MRKTKDKKMKQKKIKLFFIRKKNPNCNQYQLNKEKFGQANGYKNCCNCGYFHIGYL